MIILSLSLLALFLLENYMALMATKGYEKKVHNNIMFYMLINKTQTVVPVVDCVHYLVVTICHNYSDLLTEKFPMTV